VTNKSLFRHGKIYKIDEFLDKRGQICKEAVNARRQYEFRRYERKFHAHLDNDLGPDDLGPDDLVFGKFGSFVPSYQAWMECTCTKSEMNCATSSNESV
jgi:hypothetical protein